MDKPELVSLPTIFRVGVDNGITTITIDNLTGSYSFIGTDYMERITTEEIQASVSPNKSHEIIKISKETLKHILDAYETKINDTIKTVEEINKLKESVEVI